MRGSEKWLIFVMFFGGGVAIIAAVLGIGETINRDRRDRRDSEVRHWCLSNGFPNYTTSSRAYWCIGRVDGSDVVRQVPREVYE